MIRAHKIILEQTNDFHWKRSMANHSRKLAQNHVAAPLRREGIESDCGPSHTKFGADIKYFSDFKCKTQSSGPILGISVVPHKCRSRC